MNKSSAELPLLAKRNLLCEARSAELRARHSDLAAWAAGNTVIPHGNETVCRVHDFVESLTGSRNGPRAEEIYRMLRAADDIASAAMWVVVYMTYASRVFTDGRPLGHADFKPSPEGHTGGSLNMVPAYVGYMLANALTGAALDNDVCLLVHAAAVVAHVAFDIDGHGSIDAGCNRVFAAGIGNRPKRFVGVALEFVERRVQITQRCLGKID